MPFKESTKSFEEFLIVLSEYERKTSTKFVCVKSDKAFTEAKFMPNPKMRLHWYGTVPHFCIGRRTYACHQGKDKGLSQKKKYAEKRDSKACDENNSIQRRKPPPTKKLGCPVLINVSRVLALPKFEVSKPSNWEKIKMSETIKDKILDKEEIFGENLYSFNLPDVTSHQNHVVVPDEISNQNDIVVPDEKSKHNKIVVPNGTSYQNDIVVPDETSNHNDIVVPDETSNHNDYVVPDETSNHNDYVVPDETSNHNDIVVPDETSKHKESTVTVITSSENQDFFSSSCANVDNCEEIGNHEAPCSSNSENILKRKKDLVDGPSIKKQKKQRISNNTFFFSGRWKFLHDVSEDLRIKHKRTPYLGVPYGRQLLFKEKEASKFLIGLGNHIEEMYSKPLQILKNFRAENSNRCCPLMPIYRSSVITAYRNTQDFTIGRHHITKEKAVGFVLDLKEDIVADVYEPDDCVLIPPHMLHAAKSFEKYMRLSECDVYDPETKKGFWKQLTVRTSNCGDIMLIIAVNYPSVEMHTKEFISEKSKLKKYYSRDVSFIHGITSICLRITHQLRTSSVGESSHLDYLMGKKNLEESLLGMKFQISPEVNFYTNVPAAEILCQLVTDLVNQSSSTTVLDLHFGVGAINLCLAKTGYKVIGIEDDPKAVENATTNARINGISDVTYVCGKVDEAIPFATSNCDSMDIVAVVEFAKNLLCEQVMQVIRATKNITKVIFISSGMSPSYGFFTELCKPKSVDWEESPFYPIQAAVVDTEPYTVNETIILVFERYENLV